MDLVLVRLVDMGFKWSFSDPHRSLNLEGDFNVSR